MELAEVEWWANSASKTRIAYDHGTTMMLVSSIDVPESCGVVVVVVR